MSTLNNQLSLTPGEDFTGPSLVKFLNENYKKSSGKNFTLQDIQGYEKRNCIPKEYGGYSLEVITESEIGLKVFRLKKQG